MDAKHRLEMGEQFPYDGGEGFWEDENGTAKAPPSEDWIHRAARGVLADLTDRRGIKHELEQVDHDVRADIVASIREIIRLAHEETRGTQIR
jgi:hypothetical protein